MKYKIIIIDDERLTRKRLKMLLNNFSDFFEIIGQAENGVDAVQKINTLKPDVIFLDIQMPGLNGFEVLEQIEHHPIVIFCTAYDNYALKAFETHSIDYLLKPVEKERLNLTIEKLEKLDIQKNEHKIKKLLQSLDNYNQENEVTSIPFKIGDRVVLVKLENVTYFEAKDKYVNYYDVHGKEYLTEQTLKTLEKKLPDYFIRVSKSLITNKNKILEYQKYFKGKYILIVDDVKRTKLLTGGKYSPIIKNMFNF